MGDPFTAMTALSLAANIEQMLEYSIQIISESKEIRNGLDGAVAENRHRTVVTENLHSASCTLSSFLEDCRNADKALSPEDERLKDIASACGSIASDLLEELERLRLVSGTKHVKWNSYRQALKTVWGKGKVDHLAHTLEMYRNELKTILQSSILRRIDVADKKLMGLDETSQKILEESHVNRKLTADGFKLLLEYFRMVQPPSTFAYYAPLQRQAHSVGGYDLRSHLDRVKTFDFEHSGKLDHLIFYRPGSGAIFIIKNDNNSFRPVYAQGEPGAGIGGYNLDSPADRAFAFDYTHNGKLDHLVLYRPGTDTMWILKNASGVFSAVYAEGCPGAGIGKYDLQSPADRAFAFDYKSCGKQDHIALYRPGTGTIWILQNNNGVFVPVYHTGDPGSGIGGYYIKSPDDRAFAFDFNGSGMADHLVFYRPGAGTFWILENIRGTFRFVFAEGNPGTEGDPGGGVGGYDLLLLADRAFGFDYTGSGDRVASL